MFQHSRNDQNQNHPCARDKKQAYACQIAPCEHAQNMQVNAKHSFQGQDTHTHKSIARQLNTRCYYNSSQYPVLDISSSTQSQHSSKTLTQLKMCFLGIPEQPKSKNLITKQLLEQRFQESGNSHAFNTKGTTSTKRRSAANCDHFQHVMQARLQQFPV